jgi:hypothetical protein
VSGHTPWPESKREREQQAAFKHALRMVAREVELREEGRRLELIPAGRAIAGELFGLASLVRRERLQLLVEAGLLEAPIEH